MAYSKETHTFELNAERPNSDMDSVKMIDFKESESSSENTILIAGQGTGADREMLEISRNEV